MVVYLLSFNVERFSKMQKIMDNLISNHRLVDSWASPFFGCYLIKSSENLDKIRESFDELFERKGYLIAEIGIGKNKINGRAPTAIWDWMREASSSESSS